MRFLAKISAVCAILLFTPALAGADCICIYKGGTVTHGQTACVATAEGRELARCEKSLNISTWKFLGEPCPTAQTDEPALTKSSPASEPV